MMSVLNLSLCDARDAIAGGDLDPVDYLDALLSWIERADTNCHAFTSLEADRARALAKRRRDSWRKGKLSPLFGIPFAVKDIIDVEGSVTSCQSRGGFKRPATSTATCVEMLLDAGGVYIGKTALNEFALGDVTFDEPWPPPRNPWNTDYTAGSSSSGSGVALAARMVPLAIGTDTGGSIRSPAMMNGVVGLKPSHGRISTRGVFPLAPSMDTVGPMARSVADVDAAFRCMVTDDPCQPQRRPERPPRLGRVDHLWRTDLASSSDMEQAIDQAFGALEDAGADVEERKLPPMGAFNAVGWTTLFAEAYSVHRSGLMAHPEKFGVSTREQLITGGFISAADFVEAQAMRLRLSAAVDHALEEVDALVTATSALPPCLLEDAPAMAALAQASTRMLCNVTGHPAIALPIAISSQGLPLGIQIIGRKNEERRLLQLGAWMENRLPSWPPRDFPPLLDQVAHVEAVRCA